MTRDGRTSERGALGRFVDRLLGRDRDGEGEGARGASEGTPLFTAHQPPPSARPPEEQAPRADAAAGATTVPAETPPAEPDLFDDHPLRRAPLDAWEAEPPVERPQQPGPTPAARGPEPDPEQVRSEAEPAPEPVAGEPEPAPEPVAAEPEPAPEPVAAEPEPAPEPEREQDGLQTSVHEDALERVAPRARTAPGVRVHDDNLDQRSGPVQLTPSQAIELARGGRDALRRPDRD